MEFSRRGGRRVLPLAQVRHQVRREQAAGDRVMARARPRSGASAQLRQPSRRRRRSRSPTSRADAGGCARASLLTPVRTTVAHGDVRRELRGGAWTCPPSVESAGIAGGNPASEEAEATAQLADLPPAMWITWPGGARRVRAAAQAEANGVGSTRRGGAPRLCITCTSRRRRSTAGRAT